MKKYLPLLVLLASCATTSPTNTTTTTSTIVGAATTNTCSCPCTCPTTDPVVTTPTTPTTPPVVVPPVVVEEPKILALDEIANPQLDSTNWKSSITRTVFKNQATGFVVKGDLCLLTGKAQRILPIEIKNASAKEYSKGTYYDAIENETLTASNCKDTTYAWLELNDSVSVGGLNINIKKLETSSLKPQIPLMVQLDPYGYNLGINKGVYVNGDEAKAKDGFAMLVEHRMQPMKSWVVPYNGYNNSAWSFKEYVVDNSTGPVSVPMAGDLATLNTDVTKYAINKPWFYVVDEPSGSTVMNKLKTDLVSLKAKYPNVATMVTTTYQKDFKIDIYVPVAEHMDMYPRSTYDRLWMYVSCMSNGCGENRDWLGNVNSYKHIDYNRTGAPDLAIDAPKRDAFGFYLIAIKYKLEALLYYNSIEQWALAKKGVDVLKDQYNFGANGDGNLLYPDYAKKKPMGSLRIKGIREASFFADALILSGTQEEVSKNYVTNATSWNFNYLEREKAYSKLK